MYARAGATICIVSVQKDAVPVDFKMVMAKELTLVGALGYPTEIPQVIALLQGQSVDLEPMISHRFEGEKFMDAFATAQKPDEAAKVLVRYDALGSGDGAKRRPAANFVQHVPSASGSHLGKTNVQARRIGR